MKKFLTSALKLALDRYSTHPQRDYFIHFAFLVERNKILTVGFNKGLEPKRHFGYHQAHPSPKWHAEIDAYLKARKRRKNLKEFELVNIRLNKRGELRLSKPCIKCQELMSALGCVRIYYSCEKGFLEWRP